MSTKTPYASERRSQPRFKVKSGMFSVGNRVGRITDISTSGLAFIYIPKNKQDNNVGTHAVGAIFDESDLCLDRVPVFTITDIAVPKKDNPADSKKRRCGVLFLDLSPIQKVLLENFIWFNTEVGH